MSVSAAAIDSLQSPADHRRGRVSVHGAVRASDTGWGLHLCRVSQTVQGGGGVILAGAHMGGFTQTGQTDD